MAKNGQQLQKIGVIKTGGQIVDVLYVGGSMFMLDFPTEGNKPPAMIDKDRIDMLVEKNQLKLVSHDLYRKICDQIDPVTGDTREYHADGTKKTEVEQVLHQLNEERSTQSERRETAMREPEHGRPVQAYDESYGNEVPGVSDPSTAHSMRRSRPSRPQPQEQAFSQDDIFGDAPGAESNMQQEGQTEDPMSGERFPGASHEQGIRKADGIGAPATHRQSDSQSLEAPKSKRTATFAGLTLVTVVGCLVGFLGTFLLTRGLDLRASDVPIVGQFLSDPHDRRNLPINEQVRAGETESTVETTSGMEVVVRSDFDPEEPVLQLALADDASKDDAINFFKAIRLCYSQGNLDQLNGMIAYDYIHGQIATSYANIEQQRLGLTEEAKNSLIAQYVAILNQREGTHIANHDLDASIYCGRIREVRVDDENPQRFYVVMESLAGDHQRACFVLQGDGTGAYAVIGMINPDGYVRMIMEGAI